MPPKTKEDKILIKQFKDGSSSWWVNDAHYYLNASEELIWCAGEIDKPELREALQSFIRRNKKNHFPRPPNIFETEEKSYSIIDYGKYKGLSTQMIVAEDKRYAKWIYQNSADKKIKEELKELLKIK